MRDKPEIFEHWWEYFTVMSWCLSPPCEKKILDEDRITMELIRVEYAAKIEELFVAGAEGRRSEFSEHLEKEGEREGGRRDTIDGKALSLIGQTSIIVSLLLGASSILSQRIGEWSPTLMICSLCGVFVVSVHFVVVGLHARNAVKLASVRVVSVTDFLSIADPKELLLQKIFAVRENSFVNNVKGSYLKFAYWYYKAALVCVFLLSLALPILYFATVPDAHLPVGMGVEHHSSSTILKGGQESGNLR